jgi:hypothetical protein
MTFTQGLSTAKDRIFAMQRLATPNVTVATSTEAMTALQPPYWNNFIRVVTHREFANDYWNIEVTFRAVMVAGTIAQDINSVLANKIQFEYVPEFIEYFLAHRSLKLSASDDVPLWLNEEGVTLGQGAGYGVINNQYVGFEVPIILPFVVQIEEAFS